MRAPDPGPRGQIVRVTWWGSVATHHMVPRPARGISEHICAYCDLSRAEIMAENMKAQHA